MAGYAAWNVSIYPVKIRSKQQAGPVAESGIINLKRSEIYEKISNQTDCINTVFCSYLYVFKCVCNRDCRSATAENPDSYAHTDSKTDTDTNINTGACTNTEANINTCTGHC